MPRVTDVAEVQSFKGEYAFLSNFFVCPFLWGGIAFMSAEHAYQSSKTADPAWEVAIIAASTPGEAKRLGRGCPVVPHWDEMKLSVMESVLRAKFKDPNLRRLLLATGDAKLVEGNTWGDTFWGVCRGVGDNHLGRMLMRLRDEIRRG